MALRLIEIYLPPDHDGMDVFNDDHPFIGQWEITLEDDGRLIRTVLQSEDTEAFLEDVREELGDTVYRVVLLPVVAVMPREKEEEEDEEEDEEEHKSERLNREELYHNVVESIRGGRNYYLMVALSTVVAAGGMLRGDVAVIIGAMVIAPLIGPNIALALGATLGDTALLKTASRTNLLGLAAAFVLSIVIGAAIDFSPAADQIAARTRVDLGAMALALSAGVAGAISVTRGIPTALIGVMVAVALLPPLVALGMLLGAGYWLPAYGAGLLLLVNVTAINLAAIVTFVAQGVRPSTWFEAQEARHSTIIAIVVWVLLLALLVVAVLLAPDTLIPEDVTR